MTVVSRSAPASGVAHRHEYRSDGSHQWAEREGGVRPALHASLYHEGNRKRRAHEDQDETDGERPRIETLCSFRHSWEGGEDGIGPT